MRRRAPGTSRVRARRGEEKDTVRDLLGAAAGFLPARENRSPARAHTRKKPRACETRGRKRHGARLARRSRGLSPRPGKQEPSAGPHPEKTAGVRDAGKKKTRCATCSAQPRAFSPPGKTGAQRGPAPGINRGRARRGEKKDTVRDLPGAAARLAHRRCGLSSPPQGTEARLFPCLGKQKPSAGPHSERTACVRDTGTKQTRCASCSAQPRVLPTAGVLGAAAGSPCIRVAEYGMLRARQNRQSSRNSLRGRADAPVPWKGPGDICARPCVCR